MQKFSRCLNCDYIEDKIIPDKITLCPRCENSNWSSWPNKEILDLFDFIKKYELNSFENKLVVSVFLCSALELLLESQVSRLAYEEMLEHDSSILINILLDTFQGRSRLLQLYNRLGYQKFPDDLKQIGFPNFYQDWKALAEIRNKVIHGNPQFINILDDELLKRILSESIEIFRLLNNLNSERLPSNQFSFTKKRNLDNDKKRFEDWANKVKDFNDFEDL